jgi:RAQPRD family integrative conjugative element protein
MKKFFIIVLLFISVAANADEEKERMYLLQILNQLNAMKPLIMAAEHEQPKKIRIPFHYNAYKDRKGKIQEGLIDKINHIEQDIRIKLYSQSSEPRIVASEKGDYL